MQALLAASGFVGRPVRFLTPRPRGISIMVNAMTPRRTRVAALLALAAGGDAAWTVGCPHTPQLPHRLAQPRLRLLRRACSAWSLLPTARRRPRACTARPASSRASACATAGAPYAPLAPSTPCPAPMPAPDGRLTPTDRPGAPLCTGHGQRTATCTTSSSSAATAGRAGRASGSRARWRTRSGSAPPRCT